MKWLDVIAHVHLEANLKFTLHHKDYHYKSEGRKSHSKEKSGHSHIADSVADVGFRLCSSFSEQERMKHLSLGMEFCERGKVCDPWGVVGQLNVVFGAGLPILLFYYQLITTCRDLV